MRRDQKRGMTRDSSQTKLGPTPCGFFGNREIQILGSREIQNFGTWKSRNLGSKKMKKIKILKIQICSAQNVGKAWISQKKILPAPFGAIPCNFLHGPKKNKKIQKKK